MLSDGDRMKPTLVLLTKTAFTSPSLTKSVNGRNIKPILPGLPKKIYIQLYEAQERMRKQSVDKQLVAGVELMVVIYEIAEMLEAVQLAIRGNLGLKAKV